MVGEEDESAGQAGEESAREALVSNSQTHNEVNGLQNPKFPNSPLLNPKSIFVSFFKREDLIIYFNIWDTRRPSLMVPRSSSRPAKATAFRPH